MGKHRMVRRLGAKMAIPVALLTVSTVTLISSLSAHASGEISVVPTVTSPCDPDTGETVVTWLITPPAFVDGNVWGSYNVDPDTGVGIEGQFGGSGSPMDGPISVPIRVYAHANSLNLTVTVNGTLADATPVDGSAVLAVAACTVVQPSPSPAPPSPSASRRPSATPRVSTSSAALPSPSASASAIPTLSTSQVAVNASTSSRAVAGGRTSNSSGSGPSLIMMGSTAGILLAFVIALIFLVRERRLLRREAEDEEDEDYGYWNNYRTNLR